MEKKLSELVEEHDGDLEILIEELQKELESLNGKRLHNVECEECSGHFGYVPDEGFLYDCSDCQAYYKEIKERKEKLSTWITILEAFKEFYE